MHWLTLAHWQKRADCEYYDQEPNSAKCQVPNSDQVVIWNEAIAHVNKERLLAWRYIHANMSDKSPLSGDFNICTSARSALLHPLIVAPNGSVHSEVELSNRDDTPECKLACLYVLWESTFMHRFKWFVQHICGSHYTNAGAFSAYLETRASA